MIQNVVFCWQMEISRYLRQHARTIAGKSQLFINSYAKALEVCLLGHLCFISNKKKKLYGWLDMEISSTFMLCLVGGMEKLRK